MVNVPDDILIYHITHVDNLPSILKNGGLLSDAKMAQGSGYTNIGMGRIKERRMKIPIACHPGTFVGQYVPFYFCPRSVMLYVIHRGNSQDIKYRGGQTAIVHLVSSVNCVLAWADQKNIRWTFSDGNAGAYYTQYYNDVNHLGKINWQAVRSENFREPEIKEAKQAEFLLYDFFPFELVSGIAVYDSAMQNRAEQILLAAGQKMVVKVKSRWYY